VPGQEGGVDAAEEAGELADALDEGASGVRGDHLHGPDVPHQLHRREVWRGSEAEAREEGRDPCRGVCGCPGSMESGGEGPRGARDLTAVWERGGGKSEISVKMNCTWFGERLGQLLLHPHFPLASNGAPGGGGRGRGSGGGHTLGRGLIQVAVDGVLVGLPDLPPDVLVHGLHHLQEVLPASRRPGALHTDEVECG